jgi:hypothetical protein
MPTRDVPDVMMSICSMWFRTEVKRVLSVVSDSASESGFYRHNMTYSNYGTGDMRKFRCDYLSYQDAIEFPCTITCLKWANKGKKRLDVDLSPKERGRPQ